MRLRTTRNDKAPIEHYIPVLCITPSNPQKEEVMFIYMHDDGAESDKRVLDYPKYSR